MTIRERESKKHGKVYEVYFNYKEDGVTRRYSKSGFFTRKAAKEHGILKQAELKQNGKLKKEVNISLNEVFYDFLENDCKRYHYDTIYLFKQTHTYFKEELGNKDIKLINFRTLQKYFNSRSDKGLATNKNIGKTLKQVFNYAIKLEYIQNNPMTLVNIQGVTKETEKKNQILRFNELEYITSRLNESNKFEHKAFAIAMYIAYYTGSRLSETLSLNKNDFDFENDLIHFNKKLIYKGLKKQDYYTTDVMKSNKSKSIIPLADPLKEVLVKWFNINPYDKVICDELGLYINRRHMDIIIKQIAKEIDIDFNFHMLRHSFATNLYASNVDLKMAQELMRHENVNTTLSFYTHLENENKKEVLKGVFNKKSDENVSNLQYFN